MKTEAYWGKNDPRLFQIKYGLDPNGCFYGYH
ncbi:MAG: hypothetical protein DSY87_08855 [Methylococcus sp.]|nr:MAG: hypothetical protein DSY87_08855 [Methylococcus sp.]